MERDLARMRFLISDLISAFVLRLFCWSWENL